MVKPAQPSDASAAKTIQDMPAIVAAVQQQIAQQAPDGPIVLLHDGGGSREQTVEALKKLIPWLAEQGYRFGFPVP